MSDIPDTDPGQLVATRRVFEELGRSDPMYAALTRHSLRDNRWDPAAFFENGRIEIDGVMSYIASLDIDLARTRALDFGCAVGRLTQALAGHFERVDGVDIADAMVLRAREFNQHGERVHYHVNTTPDLALFQTAMFDFVYTNKVLQHIPPAAQLVYIREFVRVLKPGGLAIFQLRNGPLVRPGTVRSLLYVLNRKWFRRFAQRVRGKPAYEMHYVARELVENAVDQAGGRVLDVVDLSRGRPNRSLRYTVTRP